MNYEYFLQVALAKGVGDATLMKIMRFLQENNMSWREFCCDGVVLKNYWGSKNDILQDIVARREEAKRVSENLYKRNIQLVLYQDKEYPLKLKRTFGEKNPAVLFCRGNIELLNKDAVGFCGSRKVSAKGLQITSDCAQQLAESGIVVVSGYAAGTDIAAHRAALQHSGETTFVLAEGILRANVKNEIKDLLTENNHVFVSQYLPESNALILRKYF